MGVRPSSFKHATHGHHHISLYLEAYLKGLLALSVTGKGILDLLVWQSGRFESIGKRQTPTRSTRELNGQSGG